MKERFNSLLQLFRRESNLKVAVNSKVIIRAVFVVFGAFIVSSVLSTVFMSLLLNIVPAKKVDEQANAQPLKTKSTVDYHDLKESIISRNLFNSAGTVPPDDEESEANSDLKKFDINAPCVGTSLKIVLVGTIYSGDENTSTATVRENGVASADVYKAGDEILESGGAIVARIEQKKMIINNHGKKECLELKDPSLLLGHSDTEADFEGPSLIKNTEIPSGASGPATTVTLDSKYVEAELGPGFTKIMQQARVVPNIVGGNMNGFKVFGIKPGGLMAKIFQEGDVVTQVNESNLSQPDQGFALYQSFNDSQDIRINLLRSDAKTTINVQIK